MSNKQGNFKNQICVLRVNIHCDGCEKKVKKCLRKIEGVDGTMIDADLGKVTVSGYVHPNVLIQKLEKTGKHAELWGAPRNNSNNSNLYAAQNRQRNQFNDLQFENLSKPQKGGKGFPKDLNFKVGAKAPKSVKFELPPEDEFDESDCDFSDSEYEDEGFELDLGRRKPSRTPTRGGGSVGGQKGQKEKKGGSNGAVKNGKASGGKAKKKGGFFGIRLFFFRGFGRKNKVKCSSAGKKGGDGGKGGGCKKPAAIEFKTGGKNGKNGGWVLENGKNGGKGMPAAKNGGHNNLRGGAGGNNQTHSGSKNGRGVGKEADFQEIDFAKNHRKGGGAGGGGAGGGGGGPYGVAGGGAFPGRMGPMGNYPVGQMGNNQMGPMGSYPMGPMSNNPVAPMGQMGNNSVGPMGQYHAMSQMGSDLTRQMGHYHQAVQGMPAAAPTNGGYYPQAMGPGPAPMAMNHHQYAGMMMNQPPHPQQFNGMFHPAMYGRPPPMAGYAPHRPSDGYTNMFNDENTESCSIM